MDHSSPINVLFVTIGDGNFGGVSNFLYNFYTHMDHKVIHCDFLYCGENSMKSKMQDEALAGSAITTLHVLKRNNNGIGEYRKLLPALRAVFSEKKYDIVHVNSSNLFLNVCVAYALKKRAKLISHSHNTKATIEYAGKLKSLLKNFIRKPCQIYLNNKADCMFACSTPAGINLFGARGITSSKFRIVNNAIDTSQYEYNAGIRAQLRKGQEDSFIVGFVGRITDQKNPLFLIDVFSEIKKIQGNAVLWIIGEGELEQQTKDRVKAKGLNDSVIFLGRRNDVSSLMQAMDILLIPSLYEGLPIICVEAQSASLPIFASEAVPDEAEFTDLIYRISLSKPASVWANTIMTKIRQRPERISNIEKAINAGFDIHKEAMKLQNVYIALNGSK